MEMEDGDEELEAPDLPASWHLEKPCEILVSAIIELCVAVEDPTMPVSQRRDY